MPTGAGGATSGQKTIKKSFASDSATRCAQGSIAGSTGNYYGSRFCLSQCHWGLRPYVWLGNEPENPGLYENRPVGYQVQVMFQDDLTRLEADGTCTLTEYEAPDGRVLTREPSGVVPLTELTFKREDIHGLAVQTAPATDTATPAPVAASGAPEQTPKPKARRLGRKPSWETIATPYLQKLYADGNYRSATVFYNAAKRRAGEHDSPFKIVDHELFCIGAGRVTDGTFKKIWQQIRTE